MNVRPFFSVLLLSFLFGMNYFASNSADLFHLAPQATIQNVWATHSEFQNGRKGMRIHVRFNVQGLRGYRCNAVAYFADQYGTPLRDRNGAFDTKNGGVAAGAYFTPKYDNTVYNDFTFFMPYDELHLLGQHRLQFRVKILYNNNRQIGRTSKPVSFTLNWRKATTQRPAPRPAVAPGMVTVSLGKSNFTRSICLYNNRGYNQCVAVKSNSTRCTFRNVPSGTYTVRKTYAAKADIADDGISKRISVQSGRDTKIRL